VGVVVRGKVTWVRGGRERERGGQAWAQRGRGIV